MQKFNNSLIHNKNMLKSNHLIEHKLSSGGVDLYTINEDNYNILINDINININEDIDNCSFNYEYINYLTNVNEHKYPININIEAFIKNKYNDDDINNIYSFVEYLFPLPNKKTLNAPKITYTEIEHILKNDALLNKVQMLVSKFALCYGLECIIKDKKLVIYGINDIHKINRILNNTYLWDYIFQFIEFLGLFKDTFRDLHLFTVELFIVLIKDKLSYSSSIINEIIIRLFNSIYNKDDKITLCKELNNIYKNKDKTFTINKIINKKTK